ncbi:unnamed protein product [Rotaria magnacalcarata]|uniref:Pentapeptide repeat-containing protein n=2 Tax=Rotaria magnacalcarata TaxID=392030 RepID=A0A814P506_9BILA|nr:unnamed protein product [Rotaria magnacalcarata]CAF1485580.1 unnamed protein product [Rotaria magnacalcarata]CAF2154335.1 unnamed protein product [Rotaria magnacalcarata]CAF4017948.1 unnamed protein product [Rotaria magnacalcarata]CAF4094190.1 unnamed protein product [Rotaria magnacalcarata]
MMLLQERATQTDQHRSRYRAFDSFTVKDGFQFISSMILPLMLGIFTVVITFHQQKAAQEQRLEDRNESRIQREQELYIAVTQNEAQSEALMARYQDDVLVAYVKEISDLLKENNGSLTNNSIIAIIARAKTLNAVRQLDQSRNTQIIRFLYEARQLTVTQELSALDFSTAEHHDIDFRDLAINKTKLPKISLNGVFLKNATFIGIEMENVNFSSAEFDNTSFSSTYLFNVIFSYTRFINVNFSSAEFRSVNFSSAELNNGSFHLARLNPYSGSTI